MDAPQHERASDGLWLPTNPMMSFHCRLICVIPYGVTPTPSPPALDSWNVPTDEKKKF
jgi:hypothetical protein